MQIFDWKDLASEQNQSQVWELLLAKLTVKHHENQG
jgi:hypothetical protein